MLLVMSCVSSIGKGRYQARIQQYHIATIQLAVLWSNLDLHTYSSIMNITLQRYNLQCPIWTFIMLLIGLGLYLYNIGCQPHYQLTKPNSAAYNHCEAVLIHPMHSVLSQPQTQDFRSGFHLTVTGLDFSPKLQDQIQNRKPQFKASVTLHMVV